MSAKTSILKPPLLFLLVGAFVFLALAIYIGLKSGDHPVAVTDGSFEEEVLRSEIPVPDNFTQAGERYLALSPVWQDHLADNLAADLAAVSAETQSVVLGYLHSASAELGQRVAAQIAVYAKKP